MIDLILSEIKNGLVILLQVNKLKNSRLICLKFNLKWIYTKNWNKSKFGAIMSFRIEMKDKVIIIY